MINIVNLVKNIVNLVTMVMLEICFRKLMDIDH